MRLKEIYKLSRERYSGDDSGVVFGILFFIHDDIYSKLCVDICKNLRIHAAPNGSYKSRYEHKKCVNEGI